MKKEVREIRRICETLDQRVKRVIRRRRNGYFDGRYDGYEAALDYCKRLRKRMAPYKEDLKQERRELQKYMSSLEEGAQNLLRLSAGSKLAEHVYMTRR